MQSTIRGAPAASGKHAPGRVVGTGETRAHLQLAAGGDEHVREARIEFVSADPQGGGGQPLHARRAFLDRPGYFRVAQGVRERGGDSQAGNRARGQAGDEFAADAVPRIVAGFVDGHRNAGAAEREPQ